MTFLDPIMIAQKQEEYDRTPSVFPKKFYFKYRDMPDGSKKQEEWVLVAKRGTKVAQETPYRWRDIERDPAMLHFLKPYYDHWKQGLEPPVNGTPLDAWMADPELVELLRSVHIRTVEELSQLEDHLLVKLNVPGLRDTQKRAKAFLEVSKDQSKISAEITQLRNKNESLERELGELKVLIENNSIPQNADGKQYMSQAVTSISAKNILNIDDNKKNHGQPVTPLPIRRRGRPRKNPIPNEAIN